MPKLSFARTPVTYQRAAQDEECKSHSEEGGNEPRDGSKSRNKPYLRLDMINFRRTTILTRQEQISGRSPDYTLSD